jgi:hypothetical protein
VSIGPSRRTIATILRSASRTAPDRPQRCFSQRLVEQLRERGWRSVRYGDAEALGCVAPRRRRLVSGVEERASSPRQRKAITTSGMDDTGLFGTAVPCELLDARLLDPQLDPSKPPHMPGVLRLRFAP